MVYEKEIFSSITSAHQAEEMLKILSGKLEDNPYTAQIWHPGTIFFFINILIWNKVLFR